MKKHFLTVVYAIDDKPETVEAILAQRPWQAVAHTDALKDLEHAQADLDATIDGYNAARLEIESLRLQLDAISKTHAAAVFSIVPIEPTPVMRKAAADGWLNCDSKLILNKSAAALRAGVAAYHYTKKQS